jgi:hypothetical protein
MGMTNEQVATLLEKVADYVDSVAGAQHREQVLARQAKIAAVTEALEAVTGETVSPAVQQKLASTDVSVLDLLLKQAHNTGGSPYSLGGPAEIDNTKTASNDPDEIFLAFLNS